MSRQGKRVVAAAGWAGALGLLLALGQGTGTGHAETAPEDASGGAAARGVWSAERQAWRVQEGGTATLVELSLRRVSGGRGRWNSSQTLPLAELRGLDAASLEAASADVRFDWVRDAGRFACTGRFEACPGSSSTARTKARAARSISSSRR